MHTYKCRIRFRFKSKSPSCCVQQWCKHLILLFSNRGGPRFSNILVMCADSWTCRKGFCSVGLLVGRTDCSRIGRDVRLVRGGSEV